MRDFQHHSDQHVTVNYDEVDRIQRDPSIGEHGGTVLAITSISLGGDPLPPAEAKRVLGADRFRELEEEIYDDHE